MDFWKTNSIVVLLLFLIMLLLVPSASARDYTLKEGTANITVESNGIVHVEESISYTFEGTYREVFRRVYPPPGGAVSNFKGYCEGATCNFRVDQVAGGYELIGALPQPTPQAITFVVSYDYFRGLKVYNDVSELHYKLWGEEWEKPLESFTATISLPDEESVQYWIHPDDYTRQASLDGGIIQLETGRIPANRWYEVRAVFPRLETADPDYASIQNKNAMNEILAREMEYQTKQDLAKIIFYLTLVFALLVVALPIIIYFKFGREPKIDYFGLYEREPPTDSKPAVVNAIMKGRIGKPTIEGFTATVMDLVNRGYIDLKDVKSEKQYLGMIKHETEDVVIELNENMSLTDLTDFEKDVFELLGKHAKSGKILWSDLNKELGRNTEFYEFMKKWNNRVSNRIKVDKLFESRGNMYMATLGVIAAIMSILLIIAISKSFPPDRHPISSGTSILAYITIFIAISMTFFTAISQKSLGRWTPEGRLFSRKWDNFRKYLTDFSALEEHPPESIKIWDFYMVYAVTLGVADKVLKNMSLMVPSEQLSQSRFYVVHHNPVFISGFHSAYSASTPSSSGGGGVGGAGGGFGGGGGGAR